MGKPQRYWVYGMIYLLAAQVSEYQFVKITGLILGVSFITMASVCLVRGSK